MNQNITNKYVDYYFKVINALKYNFYTNTYIIDKVSLIEFIEFQYVNKLILYSI